MLTPGQAGDAPTDPALIPAVPEECPITYATADKAYDSDAIRNDLAERTIKAVIPSLATRHPIIPHDRKRYRERNQVERPSAAPSAVQSSCSTMPCGMN